MRAQTHQIAEIIVVDDASDDGLTPDIVLEAAAADSRIKLLRQLERRGASAARNVGWRAAKSDWIAFLDSDDKWSDDKVAKQAALLRSREDCVACFTGFRAIGHVDPYVYSPPKRITLLMLQKANALGTTSTAIVSRGALELLSGFDETLPSCQDWDLWIRLQKLGNIVTLDEPLTYFEHTGSDRITKNMGNVLAGHKIIFEKTRRDIKNPLVKIQVVSSHMRRMSEILLHDFDKPLSSIKYSLASLVLFPNIDSIRLLRRGLYRAYMEKDNIGSTGTV